MTAKPGIWVVTYNQISLAFFQKLHAADRSAVGNFDPDIWIHLMKFLQIVNKKIAADRVTGGNTQLAF